MLSRHMYALKTIESIRLSVRAYVRQIQIVLHKIAPECLHQSVMYCSCNLPAAYNISYSLSYHVGHRSDCWQSLGTADRGLGPFPRRSCGSRTSIAKDASEQTSSCWTHGPDINSFLAPRIQEFPYVHYEHGSVTSYFGQAPVSWNPAPG